MGARFSDDSRVYEDGVLGSSGQEDRRGEPRVEQSVGWKWIRQIQLVRQTFTEPPSIYEVQTYAVYVLFVQATTTPESCWILVSIGVRFAQDVGAHRKKPENTKVTVRNELWKRVFWMLYVMDMFTSAYLGRPRSIAREDFDVEFPVDCDDEYWEENPDDPGGGGGGFRQPLGKPSIRHYIVSLIKLMDILALAMRTIYAVRKSDMWTSMGQSALEWTEKMVAELDSSLNKWIEEVPEHLRWDPHRENVEHFHQSVMLYTTYYWIQTLVHRPFIASPGTRSVLSFPSLTISANAARSYCHVMDVQRIRNCGVLTMPNLTIGLMAAAIVLLLNVWRGERLHPGNTGSATMNVDKELADVYRCVNLLSLHEKRWQHAGRYCDILKEIIAISHSHHGKRLADSGKLLAKRSSATMDTSSEGKGNDWSQMPLESPSQPQPPPPEMTSSTSDGPFNLPTHRSLIHDEHEDDELGILPIAESFSDWTTVDNQPEWLSNIITGLPPSSFNFRPDLDEVHGHDGVIGLGSGAETTGLVPSPPIWNSAADCRRVRSYL
ncbi:hypothetical protein D9757_012844 [Collybiopsis confluens]|uniref:Xylanolytic transcriptional activator regulatory domain-containing protein n=1 Tax=Collybiopsis confluens TaxID=2823264 RepID=A0A8H5FW28_9AGAR|nr:hypothetical protein D9757_012844 [Collybiopsis confluens]